MADIVYQNLAQLFVQAPSRFLKLTTAILRLRTLHAEHTGRWPTNGDMYDLLKI